MTTLKQKFDYITRCYATIEEKNKMYYQAVKDWLQQEKEILLKRRNTKKAEKYDYIRINHFNELSEKLK